jgi:hypothetical protein
MALGGVPSASIAAPPPSAQGGGHSDPNYLHLTPDQQKKMQVRQKQMSTDWNALVQDKTMTDQQKQAKAQELQKSYQTDMLAMLTPAQRVLVDKQRADAMKRKAFADARMKQIVDVQTKLLKSLNPTQSKQITAIRDADFKIFQSIQGDKSLSESAKQSKVADLTKGENVKINAILNPTQRANFQKLQDLLPVPPGGPPH